MRAGNWHCDHKAPVQMPEISTGHHSPESAQELGLKIQAHKVRWDHYQLTAVNSAALNYAGLLMVHSLAFQAKDPGS